MKYSLKEVKSNKDLVKTINRVFHDVESRIYHTSHPEIYDSENVYWANFFEEYLDRNKSKIILDVGSGAGFVIGEMSEFLTPKDEVIFSDISENMLNVCRRFFGKKIFKKKYIQCDASNITLPDESVDLITANSVLHHFPDSEDFFKEVNRILKPDGLFMIRHEPNNLFVKSNVLRGVYYVYKKFVGLKLSLGKKKEAPNNLGFTKEQILAEVLEGLKNEGVLFEEKPSTTELQSIVDIESPTAMGGMDRERGFDPYLISSSFFNNFEVKEIDTYNFLGKFNEDTSMFTKAVSLPF